MPPAKTNKHPVPVGGLLHVWWATDRPGNMATVLAVLPYTGRYTQFCDCTLRLSASNTRKGWVEMAYNSADYARETPPTPAPAT